jgi:hypothetical protein
MMTEIPRRRRGPNKPKEVAIAPEAPAEAVKPSRRRKRADVGGQHLKLSVPPREGYHRRWVNDVPGRVAMMKELAYEIVTDPSIKSDGLDSKRQRLVGTQAGGAPQNAVLMETPLAEYQYGVEEKEEARKPFEDAIRRGEDPLGNPVTAKTKSHDSYIR